MRACTAFLVPCWLIYSPELCVCSAGDTLFLVPGIDMVQPVWLPDLLAQLLMAGCLTVAGVQVNHTSSPKARNADLKINKAHGHYPPGLNDSFLLVAGQLLASLGAGCFRS